MMTKRGINETKAEKTGPTVKQGITSSKRHKKVLKCACGALLEKECGDALTCEVSSVKCPKCGKLVG